MILFLCCCFNYWLPSNTWAAETNADVGTFTRNNQINQTQLQQQLNADQTRRKKSVASPTVTEPFNPPPPIVPAITTATDVRYFTEISVLGSHLLSPNTIETTVAPYRNKPLLFKDIEQLAEQLTQQYHQQGYTSSRVFIPEQSFAEGVLLLQTQEVTIGDVVLETKRWFGSNAIKPRLSQTTGDLLNIQKLTHELEYINQNPDLKVGATLQPGKAPNTTDVIIKTREETFPFHVTAHTDSFGRSSTGQLRSGYIATANNLTGLGDELNHTLLVSEHSRTLLLHYELPIGSNGFRIGGSFAHSSLEPQGAVAALNLKASAVQWGVTAEQPLYRNVNWQVNGISTLHLKNIKTRIPTSVIQYDAIRTLDIGIEATHTTPSVFETFTPKLTFSTDWLGATSSDNTLAGRRGTSNHFTYLSGDLFRLQALPWQQFRLKSRLSYQAALEPLPYSEQIQAGGNYLVRGFPEG